MQDLIFKKFTSICKKLILNEPFYGYFLLSLNKQLSTKVETAGVRINNLQPELIINPDFFNSLSDDHKYGLIKHELLHIVFEHCVAYDHLTDKKLANIAMDLYINQLIEEKYLPQTDCVIENFLEYGLKYNESTNIYYDKLKQKQDKLSSIKEPTHDWQKLSELEKKLIKKNLENIISETANIVRKTGNIPKEVNELISTFKKEEPAVINWKNYFRKYIDGATNEYVVKTRRKLSNRFIDSPALKLKYHAHHLLALDTSASVSNNEIEELMHQVYLMNKTGHLFTIVQFDTKINSIDVYKKNKPLTIKGRGGTDFNEVMNYFLKHKKKYASLTYLTDGEAYDPSLKYKKTLWLHVKNSSINHDLTGIKIKMQ